MTVPGALPGVGHLLKLIRRPLEFLKDAQTHGDVVVIRLGPVKAYFVNQPESLRAMLVANPGDYDKGVHFEKAKLVIGDSLPVSAGAFHRRQRKMIRPAFAVAMLREYFEIMKECTLRQVAGWTAETDTYRQLRRLVGIITARSLYSVEADEAATAELVSMIDTLDAGVTRRILDQTGLLEKLPLPANRRFERAKARTDELMRGFIDTYRHRGTGRRDLLSTLLEAKDDGSGEGMSDEQLRDEAIAILHAGVETTAQTLRWVFHALGRHPEIQQRVQAEIDDVVGGRDVTFDDLERLDLTRRVITESLRIHPPLFVISRRPITDVQAGLYRIPAGSTVLFSSYALHHDPKVYDDPDRFDPDRWLPGGATTLPAVSYLPFGAGLRSCLGERFAMIEMLTILATVLRRFTVRRDPSVTVRPKLSFVLAPSASGTTLVARSDAPIGTK